MTDLSSKKAKNTVIRSSALAEDGVTFITGSENGLLSIWAKEDGPKDQNETSLKAKESKKTNKTPYTRWNKCFYGFYEEKKTRFL